MPNKAEYERLKAAGLCPSCGKRPPAPGRVTCQECVDRKKEWNAVRYEELKAAGLCTSHPDRPAVEGNTRCQGCLDRVREWSKERYEERIESNLCTRCGMPLPEEEKHTRLYCHDCGLAEMMRHTRQDQQRQVEKSRLLYEEAHRVN